MARRPDPFGNVERLIAGAGRDVEHIRAGLHARHSEHHLRRLM
jgi:hypothetical protein